MKPLHFKTVLILIFYLSAHITSRSQPLNIPGMETKWMTYLDANQGVYYWQNDILISKQGDVFAMGTMHAGQFGNPNLISANGFQNTPYSSTKAVSVISKIDSLGKIIWGTYFFYAEQSHISTIDSNDNLLIAGYKFNTDQLNGFTTPGAYLTNIPANTATSPYGQAYGTNLYDGTLAKLSPDGQLLWGTYIGGKGNDFVGAICTDTDGNIYIAGATSSLEDIATPGAFKSTYDENIHSYSNAGWYYRQNAKVPGFLMKFSPGGQKLWGTYLSVAVPDSLRGNLSITDIKTDKDRNIFLTGFSTSPFPNLITPGAAFPEVCFADTCKNNFFLIKFNSNGQLQWGTYYPGIRGGLIGVAAMNSAPFLITQGTDVFLIATTTTPGLGTTGSMQPNLAGGSDGFVAKFNKNGKRLWHTYIGGPDDEALAANKIALSKDSCFFLSGATKSTTGFADSTSTFNPNRPIFNTFVAKMDFEGRRKWIVYTSPETSYTLTPPRAYLSANHTGKVYQVRGTRAYDALPLPYLETVQPNPSATNTETNYLTMLQDTTTWVRPIDTTSTIDNPSINLDSISIVMYPNPNSGSFTLQGFPLEKDVYEMAIYNLMGQKLW